MVAELLSRVACNSGGEKPLKVCLRRITESEKINIPPELLAPVVEASHDADSRRDIMRHLRECLSEPTGKHWHRIHGGLALVEKLMEQGSPALVIETAHGHHFDLIQKVSFLEQFDSAARGCSAARGFLIRKKANELRTELVPQLQKASARELPMNAGLNIKDTVSACSFGDMSTSTGSTAASSMRSSEASQGAVSSHSSAELPRPGLLSRMTRRHKSSNVCTPEESLAALTDLEPLEALPPLARLEVQLKRITDFGIIDIPQELFTFVLEASHEADMRQMILEHLQRCFVDASGKQWRRIFGGLALAESLLMDGSPLIFTEGSAHGAKFNLAQQIWYLEQFEYRPDWRAQNMVRKKAKVLHNKLVSRHMGSTSEPEVHEQHIGEAFSTLRDWIESADASGPSTGTSPRPSSASSQSDRNEEKAGPGGGSSSHSWGDATAAGDSGDDAFFTPLPSAPTPRPGRPAHLLSL